MVSRCRYSYKTSMLTFRFKRWACFWDITENQKRNEWLCVHHTQEKYRGIQSFYLTALFQSEIFLIKSCRIGSLPFTILMQLIEYQYVFVYLVIQSGFTSIQVYNIELTLVILNGISSNIPITSFNVYFERCVFKTRTLGS